MSSNGIVSLSSFNLFFFTQVLTVLTTTIKYNEYVTDKGKNITIPCDADGSIMWIKETDGNNPSILQTGTVLVLANVSEDDRGLYVCLSAPIFIEETENNLSNSNETDIIIDGNNTLSSSVLISSDSSSSTVVTMSSSSSQYVTTEATLTSDESIIYSNNNNNNNKKNNNNNNKIFKQFNKNENNYFQEYLKANLSVRTPPGPVTQLYFKTSTVLGFLVWRFNKRNSGGYPLRSFTAEYRNISYGEMSSFNRTYEHEWIRLDPINIAPNVRQMEIYHLEPNTSYEFRIWGNNNLGAGDIVTTNVTTLPETREEDLIRLIQADIDNFDPRTWIVAVSIVLGTFVILSVGLCFVMSNECRKESRFQRSSRATPRTPQTPRSPPTTLVNDNDDDGCDNIELIPNIILNPGFCESDETEEPYTRTIFFGEDDESDGYDDEQNDNNNLRNHINNDDSDDDDDDDNIVLYPEVEPLKQFRRKVSIFFTGPTHTLKRI